MKWTLTIEGIDLGSLIPDEADLKPHDYPLKAWAAEVICGFLNDLHTHKLMGVCEALGEKDPVVKEALLAALHKEVEVTKQMTSGIKITREP